MVVKMVVKPIAKLSEEAWVRSWVCMRWLVDTIVMPKTTDRLCAPYLRRGEVSCQNGDRVVLNAKRWLLGADSYGSDLTNYRRYLVNHEFGHALGKHHVDCPGPGRLAPVMMQHHQGARRLPEEPGRNPAKIDGYSQLTVVPCCVNGFTPRVGRRWRAGYGLGNARDFDIPGRCV
jgi:Protein of unknown function (DUF3152)